MQVEVDPIREVVRIEGRTWPFEVDCRTNTATLVLEGRPFVLRPLFWQEKCNLARFAHLGDAFVKHHFLKICLAQDQPLPEDYLAQEALGALARWINAPGFQGGALPLPLDAALLATVTLEVCRALGSIAAALDGREAGEVELFWQAARQSQAPVAAGPSPGGPLDENLTRIAVVPDSDSWLETPPGPEGEPESTAPSVPENTPFTPRELLARATAAPKPDGVPLSEPAFRTAPAQKESIASRQISGGAETEPGVMAPLPSRAERPRFRVVDFKQATSEKSQPAPVRLPGAAPGESVRRSTAVEIAPSPEIVPALCFGGQKFPEAGPSFQVMGPEAYGTPSEPELKSPPFPAQQPPFGFPPISSPASSRLSPEDKEELLTELGRRLDEAMADLGLDVEV